MQVQQARWREEEIARNRPRPKRAMLWRAAPVSGLGVGQCRLVPRAPTLHVFVEASNHSHVPNRDHGLAEES
jgi:hypothetical protein